MKKAYELTSLEDMLKTQVIKKKDFKHQLGRSPTLIIFTEKMKKDKKKKRKIVENDVNSEAVQ